ncbi:ABC transporter ATP-binding protein [Gemmobacter fulvus]|uniref:ABC transporter ATP-binding protein n=1 Tax=Gemmobacter fulvus TaxID=2840474 RepID=A0A975RZI2_9RHOB|nr:ABC transporter ATP-binding protein [Gemmobacter fulvus]MBT9246797.1 ABC transporter ATP-binding protein [Gemmobacter fulvus]QWK89104.1 ABC transporter ATP-binding protein [Gemmobacter fulvus]
MKGSDMTKGSVRFENVTKRYGEVMALKPLTLDIQPGTLCTLLGPSGCGKTTTLRLIAGLESASEGRILIGGQDVTHLSATYRRVSMVFQSYALFPHMTVAENVAYGLSVKRMPKAEATARAEAGLEMVGLKGFGARLPSELSGGQQQRVAVARAIVLEPEVLLLDEPLSNLDAKLRRHVREEIRQIQQRLGLTAVYVTHDQEEAMAVSDRIIVMKNAEIAQSGTPQDLYERPASAFIADFIGDANLLDAEVTATGAETRVRLLGHDHDLPLQSDRMGPAKLVLRPHQVQLHPAPRAGSIAAEITYAAYLGNHIQYTMASAAGEIFAILPPTGAAFRKGDTVHVGWRPEDIRLVAA